MSTIVQLKKKKKKPLASKDDRDVRFSVKWPSKCLEAEETANPAWLGLWSNGIIKL